MPAEAPAKPSFLQQMNETLKDSVPPGTPPPAPAKPAEAPKPPAAPQTPPAPNTDDIDREIEAGKRSPKSEDFKRVKTAAAEARKKLDEFEPKVKEYEKELAELKKQPKHNAELIKQITEERDRFKGMFEQVAVELSPEFQSKYQNRLASVKASLPTDSADRLMALLQLPDSDVKRRHLGELTSEMDEFQVAEIVAANREVRTILNERQGELAKSQDALTKIGEERTKKAQERATALGKVFEEVISKAQDEKQGLPVFQFRQGDEEWNKGVKERLAIADALFHGKVDSDNDRAEGALWAAAAPEFLSQLKAVSTELAQAKETIAKMQGTTPAINGQGAPGATGEKLSFAQRIDRELKGQPV